MWFLLFGLRILRLQRADEPTPCPSGPVLGGIVGKVETAAPVPLRDAGPRRASFRLWQEAELERELGEKLGHLKTVNLGCDVTWDGVRGGERSGVQGTHVVGTVLAGAARVSVPAGRPRLLIRKLPHRAEAEQFYRVV